jgi:hypothetical protein
VTVVTSLTTGSTKQSVVVFGGICQPAGAWPGMEARGGVPLPPLVALQVVDPWSNCQLCPPTTATGKPAMPLPFFAMVLTFVGSLFSKLELSGTKTDPAVAVKTFGDMFASDGAAV